MEVVSMNRKIERLGFNSFLIKSFQPGISEVDEIKKLTTYHYTSPNAFLSIMETQSIRFTDIRYLNDKSEGIYFIKVLLDFIEKHSGKYPYFEEVINRLIKGNNIGLIKRLEVTNIEYNDVPRMPYVPKRVFVFCTCTEADSLNMWNYYVNNGSYQGYNIGLRVIDLLKTFDTPETNQMDAFIVRYGKVLYKEKDQFAEIQRLAEETEKYIAFASIDDTNRETKIKYAQIDLRNYIHSCGAFYKHPKFESEQEFRIIIEIAEERVPRKIDSNRSQAEKYFGENNKKIVEGFTTKCGLIVPFLSVVLPKNAIFRVTMAPMVEFGIAKKSVKELLSVEKISGVQIHKSSIPIRF